MLLKNTQRIQLAFVNRWRYVQYTDA